MYCNCAYRCASLTLALQPISYLLSFSTCVIGAFYFAMTRSDYSYENAWCAHYPPRT